MKGEVAVVGGGIAGVLSARLLSHLGYRVTLFERSNRLGGCAGSFVQRGVPYNIAATTIGGLFPGFPVERIFQLLKLSPQQRANLTIHNPTFWVKGRKKEALLPPYAEGLTEALSYFGDLPSKQILKLLRDTTNTLSSLHWEPYFHLNGLKSKIKSLFYLTPLALRYGPFYQNPATKYLQEKISPELPPDLQRLLQALVMITAQADIKEVNTFTLNLAIGYPLTGVGSVLEGNENLFHYLAEGVDYYLNTPVNCIRRLEGSKRFLLQIDKEEVPFERVIFAAPILDNANIFADKDIREYLNRFTALASPYSALLAYGIVSNFEPKAPHCLLLTEKTLGGLTSGNYLLSFLPIASAEKTYSFTLSTHSPLHNWREVPYREEIYHQLKESLSQEISFILREGLDLSPNQLEIRALATPHTFDYYLGRKSLGGIPVTMRNTLWRVPGNITPFRGLYFLSDQTLFYQGWVGISLGLLNLYRWWQDEGL